MPPKRRSYKSAKAGGPAKKRRKASVSRRKSSVKDIVKQVLNRNLETKAANTTSTDGMEILHNDFVTPDAALLYTTQGITDPAGLAVDSRIGDEIMLKGISLKMMLELNERYSDVTFRIMVVRCAKGDTPTRATLFNGLSGNKMIDTLNRERYTVIAQKYCKLTARNPGTQGSQSVPLVPTGTYHTDVATTDSLLSRATKIVKLWIPGSKFGKGGKIVYENGTSQVKFFDYRVIIYAYSNYSTSQDIYYVGRLNDYVKQIFFKDG